MELKGSKPAERVEEGIICGGVQHSSLRAQIIAVFTIATVGKLGALL